MKSEEELISKLLVSKKIMERHNNMPRGQSSGEAMTNENVSVPEPKYNLPQEFVQESKPRQNLQSGPPTKDRILNSKLPDEIKRLMIEHPISQPQNQFASPLISNELAEKASRLMNVDASGKQIRESSSKQSSFPTVNKEDLKSIVRETIIEIWFINRIFKQIKRKFYFQGGKTYF
jgi:hypothetical protein